MATTPVDLREAPVLALIRRVGQFDQAAAAGFQRELAVGADFGQVAFAASQFLAKLGGTSHKIVGLNRFADPAVARVAGQFQAIAAAGPKSGDARTADFSGIERGLQALGV